MMNCEQHSAHAIFVGTDEQLANQLRDTIESKTGWQLQQIVDVATAATIQSQQPSISAVILYIDDALSYTQTLEYLQASDRKQTPATVIYDRLDPKQLLELYRADAVECLGRPVNLTRLSLVLDMLFVPGLPSSKESVSAEPPAQQRNWQDQMLEQVGAVASLSTTILIVGETGTGKTRLSRLIHGMSNRKDKPFLALNCGALSESLLDTELFGHVKGAFTGAEKDYAGKLTQCRDGTLLLDEVDMLSPAAQVKLLQVVEERIFQPVGSSKFEPLQARLIVASNRPLQEQVAEGQFRSDLFYRLNVMSFQLPPLRDRPDEIAALASKFVAEFANQHGFTTGVVARSALAALEAYAWPGNIRELRNVIERAVILSAGETIQPTHLPSHVVDARRSKREAIPQGIPNTESSRNKLVNARNEAERAQLLDALDRNGNNRSKTAIDLGISRVALYKRLRKLQIV